MTKEIFTPKKFTEIINNDQFDTVKNIHLIEKQINEIEGNNSIFVANLIKNCFNEVKTFFEDDYIQDIEIIKKFIEDGSDLQALMKIFRKYESHHLNKPDQIGPYIIELTEAEAIERQNVFHYHFSVLPSFKETATGMLKGEDSIFKEIITHTYIPPKEPSGLFIKPNPKYKDKSTGGFFKLLNEVMNEPFIKVKSDYDLFNEKRSLFYENFIGPKKPFFLIEQEESQHSREYIQKHILKEISSILLLNLNDELVSEDLTVNFNIKKSWVRLFSLCSSLLIENDYQIFNQEFNDNEESKLESITERNRLKGYRNFNLYKNDQYSLCVDIPKVLRDGLTKSYFDFYSHLNNRGSSALNSINESIPHQIEALVRLREANHISEDEFLLAKKKILGL
jgi:hypothetical protein